MKFDNTYELYGFFNLFETAPDFVDVVVRKGKDLFLLNTFDGKTIDGVIPINKPVAFCVKPKGKFKRVMGNEKLMEVKIGDNMVYAFQSSRNAVNFGTHDDLRFFFKSYEIKDQSLKEQINDFLKNPSYKNEKEFYRSFFQQSH